SFPVLSLESLHASRRIDQFLFAREKRMTLRADLEVNLGLRRPCPESFAACAFDDRVDVIRMYVGFHRPPINHLLYTFPFDFTYRIDYSTANQFNPLSRKDIV